jgi:hypothetical protein
VNHSETQALINDSTYICREVMLLRGKPWWSADILAGPQGQVLTLLHPHSWVVSS